MHVHLYDLQNIKEQIFIFIFFSLEQHKNRNIYPIRMLLGFVRIMENREKRLGKKGLDKEAKTQ